MLTMQLDLIIKTGQPFEQEWTANYDVFSNDHIDNTIPFRIVDSEGNVCIDLYLNYGLSFIKFDHEDSARLIVSIFDTDIIPVGKYSYSYHPYTFSGHEIGNYFGTIEVIESDQLPSIIRQARPWDLRKNNQKKNELEEEQKNVSTRTAKPWDLFRSQSSPEGERVSDEKQEERLSICKDCPRYVKFTSQCLECGCIMKLKTKLAAATCPLGKW